MTKITQAATDDVLGVIHQRTTTREYRWVVVSPSQWNADYSVAWTAQVNPRLKVGDRLLPARTVTDPVELTQLAVWKAEAHLKEQQRQLDKDTLRGPVSYHTPDMHDRWISELQQRVATATKSLDAARKRLVRVQAARDKVEG